ncbi:AbgT family transporter [Salinisphaera orenii]|uniref:Aminobenzoyl-glutamate transporter n=1 Tax=Salinisphaera orenii YIM 95161 TaxID=1051139 RepID=A0A423PDC0_9GAMM|nr:AbgT family transporter [Salinisphaera halophila]ROO23083.1 aminobenzoyl-glutamate transporter [Salinisphaera halophila YIM 95161]
MNDRGMQNNLLQRMLNGVERTGNRLPHPVTLFALLAGLVAVVSALLSLTGISVEPPGGGEAVTVNNLLSGEGIRYIFGSLVDNFIGFAPLGVVLATMIGIGMAERTGLISVLLRSFILSIPKSLITFGLVFAGILSSLASDAGYVVLPPLGAMIFAALGRHPIAGLAAAFAGVSAGYSANLLLSAVDVVLGQLTIEAAATIDPAYAESMNLAMNYFFIIASTFFLALVGTLVSQFVVEPRLGRYQGGYEDESRDDETTTITAQDRRGMKWAGVAFLVTVALMALLVVPPGAPLRGEGGAIVQSPFMESLAVVLLIIFFVPGLVYGVVTGAVKNDSDVAHKLSDTMAGMGMFIMLAFTAGQFVAWFAESNLGIFMAVYGAEFLQAISLGGVPLLILFVVIVGFINLFIGSASAKWAILAPVFVPIMMQLGYSPELTQMAYRVADSSTNIITPLMPYFALIIAYAQQYDKNLRIGSLISIMLPFSLAFLLFWTLLLIVWMLLGLPLGPGASTYYGG